MSIYPYAMNKIPLTLLCLLCFAALGCGGEGRYQIVSTAKPGARCDAYRLDTQTGEVLCIATIQSIPVEPLEISTTPTK
jgi:hypothetical protein